MSNWFKIQWFFHDVFSFTNFKNFSWNSMIFPWSWNRSEIQWFFKSCGNPVMVPKRLIWVLTSVTLTFYLWPRTFAQTSLLSLVIPPENFMMIPWWEHSEKGVTGTDRQRDRQTERQTERKTLFFFLKENPFETVICIFVRPKYRLIWCLFIIKVYHQPKLKRNSAYLKISKQNPVSVKKKIPDIFSTSSKRLQDPKWKSRLCSTIFIISYQTLAQCMCQSSTPIHYMYNLHNILYKISYNSI